MSGIDSHSRAPNFTTEEHELLMDMLQPYMHILESKKTDNVKHSQKQAAWAKVAEAYNANTKSVHRSMDNLLACYRNLKSKIKKKHSSAKMNLKDSSTKEAFVDALEEYGKNWEAVAKEVQQPVEICKKTYKDLEKEFIKKDKDHKRVILGTGGGPPPPPTDEDSTMERFKKMIGPQVDGMYTVYDGDALLMTQFQKSIPNKKDRILPIEHSYVEKFGVPVEYDEAEAEILDVPVLYDAEAETEILHAPVVYEADADTEIIVVDTEEDKQKLCKDDNINMPGKSQTRKRIRPIINRQEILKKKKATALVCEDVGESKKKPKTLTDKFTTLSEQKLDLVMLQKEAIQLDINHKIKIHKMEEDNLLLQHAHNEEMRKKEMYLINLKIRALE